MLRCYLKVVHRTHGSLDIGLSGSSLDRRSATAGGTEEEYNRKRRIRYRHYQPSKYAIVNDTVRYEIDEPFHLLITIMIDQNIKKRFPIVMT